MMQELIDQFEGKRIAIVGDVMLDSYVVGRVTRISPEAPIPVLDYEKTVHRLGGAANVALNISKLGGIPKLFSVIGNDEEGLRLKSTLQREGIGLEGVLEDPSRITTVKTRMLSGDQQLLRVDREIKTNISEKVRAELVDQITAMITSGSIDALLFQDYDKGVLSNQLIQTLIKLCKTNGVSTAADPKFDHFFDYQEIDLFKPNWKEYQEAINQTKALTKENIEAAHELIFNKLHHRVTLLTLGDQGLFVASQSEKHVVKGVPMQVHDVCGAGDTVISVATLCLASDISLKELATLANLAAAWTCTKAGVVPITKEQLASLV